MASLSGRDTLRSGSFYNRQHAASHSPVTGSALKVIAMATMLIDHAGFLLFPQYPILRWIGRMAFPIFIFLLIEGYFHTHSKPQYFLRLVLFALLSQMPFGLVFRQDPFCLTYLNTLFTLSIGFLVVWIIDGLLYLKNSLPHTAAILYSIAGLFCIALLLYLANRLHVDYRHCGVLAVAAGFLAARRGAHRCIVYACICLVLLCFYDMEIAALLMLPLIQMYHGKRGRRSALFQYACYMFYPVHLVFLYAVYLLMVAGERLSLPITMH